MRIQEQSGFSSLSLTPLTFLFHIPSFLFFFSTLFRERRVWFVRDRSVYLSFTSRIQRLQWPPVFADAAENRGRESPMATSSENRHTTRDVVRFASLSNYICSSSLRGTRPLTKRPLSSRWIGYLSSLGSWRGQRGKGIIETSGLDRTGLVLVS